MLDRMPPSAVETEDSIISTCLNFNDQAVEAVDLLSPEHFYKISNQNTFKAVCNLVREKSPVNLPAVVEALKSMGALKEAGGATRLASLMDAVPVSANLLYHAGIIRGKYDLRRLIEVSGKMIEQCYYPSADPESVVDSVQSMVNSVAIGRKETKFRHIRDVLSDTVDRCEAIFKSGRVTGLPTGYKDFDEFTCGFQPGDLIILAGRPSMGKTALALNCIRNQAQIGMKAAIFSMEMPYPQLGSRFLAMQAFINSNKFRSGKFEAGDWESIYDAAEVISKWGVYIDDTASQTYQQIIRKARQLHNQEGIDILYLDYLGFIEGDKGNSTAKEVESVTRALKSFAKEVNIPVVLLVQLNRQCESRTDKRPLLSDLRDSGAIEQDADVVAFIYRHEQYLKKFRNNKINPDWEKWHGVAEVLIRKQRNGPVGEFTLTFRNTYTRFEDYLGPRY